MRRGRFMAVILSVAMLASQASHGLAGAAEGAGVQTKLLSYATESSISISADKMITVKGWDGISEEGLDIADKQSGLDTYNIADAATGKGHDVNMGFVCFTIPANTETGDLKLRLTSSKGQYSHETSAYAAVADLSSTVVSGQSAAENIDSITWANRPALGNTSAPVSYVTGGTAYVDDVDNNLIIPLKNSSGEEMITKASTEKTVVLAIYFDSAPARETFSAAEIVSEEQEPEEDATEYLNLAQYYAIDYSCNTSVNPSYAFDDNTSTAWAVNRDDTNSNHYCAAYMVFYAGDGKAFDLTGIKTTANDAVTYYGTNDSKIMFTPNIMVKAGTDISQNNLFTTEYNLTKIVTALKGDGAFKTAEGKYRYIIAEPNGWKTTSISEINISAKLEDETAATVNSVDTLLIPSNAYSLPKGMAAKKNTLTSAVNFAPFGLTANADCDFIEMTGVTETETITYKVNANSAAEYILYVLGSSTSEKRFAVKTNASEAADMTMEGPVNDNTAIYSTNVKLNAGTNTISILGRNGGAPAMDAVYAASTAADINAEAQNKIQLYSLKGRVMARYTAYYNKGTVTVKLTDGKTEKSEEASGSGVIEMEKASGQNTYTAQLLDDSGTVLAAADITASNAGFSNLNNVRLTNDGSSATEKALGEYALFDSANIGLDYVLSLDTDKLLYPAYDEAGLAEHCGASSAYGGWEQIGIKGHTLGHYLSALSVFYASTEGEKKTACLEKIRKIVNELDYIQTNSKYMDPESPDYNNGLDRGYIGGIDPVYFNKGFHGTVTTGFPGTYNGGWAPWYNVHKTYQGLIDAYNNTIESDPELAEKALKVCKNFSDWAVNGLDMMSDELVQEMLEGEFGGIGETMFELFEITGNYDYLRTAKRFTHEDIINPLAERKDLLTMPENTHNRNEHANTQIPKISAVAGIYTGDRTETDYKEAAEYFWHEVTQNRSYVFGGNSIEEFFEPLGDETLGAHSAESCNTHNMLLLTQRIFNWNHDSCYMDYYENALYNHIIGTQNPVTGGKSYFTSTLPGGHRTFSEPYNSFWCCTGTGMENPGRYGETIYYEDGNDLYVNLFVQSTLEWAEKGMKLSQHTKFPYEDTTTLRIDSVDTVASANIKIRIPSWISDKMTVSVNGKAYASAEKGESGYITISKSDWKAGDEITAVMPMELTLYRNKADSDTVAFQYGPILLGTKLGEFDGCTQKEQLNPKSSETVEAPKLKAGIKQEDLHQWFTETKPETLTFTLSGDYTSDGKAYDMTPFFGISTQSYNVYWNTETTSSEDYILGDVNDDGHVTAVDALLTLKIFIADGQGCSGRQKEAADYNRDGSVDTEDVLAVLHKASGKIDG